MAPSFRPRSRSARVYAVWGALFTSACFSPGDGVEPPLDSLYFPVGVALGVGGDRLYVANSDSDLRYNGGTVVVLDAEKIRGYLPVWCASDDDCTDRRTNRCKRAEGDEGAGLGVCVDSDGSWCGELDTQSPSQQFIAPGLCEPLDVAKHELVLGGVKTAPFSTDIRYTTFIDGKGRRRGRLFLPVRGDASLHWMDVETEPGEGPVIDCGQTAPTYACDEQHRAGNEEAERSVAGAILPPEPSGIGVSADGRVIVVPFVVGPATPGKVALFVNGDRGPRLEQVIEERGINPMAAAPIPVSRYQQRFGEGADALGQFLFTFSHVREAVPYVELLRAWPASPSGTNAFLQPAGRSVLTPSSNGRDSRGIAVDTFARDACESSCACDEMEQDAGSETDVDACRSCLQECASVPVGAYVAHRTPPSLLIGQTQRDESTGLAGDLPSFVASEPLRGGPSRITTSSVINRHGEREPRVFVLSYDSGLLSLYNPRSGETEAHISVGRGPQGLTVDPERGLLYLAHFTDSFVSIVDIDQRHSTYAKVLLNVGVPVAPVSAQ